MNTHVNAQTESLIRIASRLIELLCREVEMLRAMRVADIESLRTEKQDLTIAYEQGVKTLAAAPGALEAIEPALKEALADVARQFDGALAENARAINAVRDSHERLLKAIVDAVAEQRAREKSYAAYGRFSAPRRNRRVPGLSLTLDRRL